jgi:hypothetical protein
MTRDDMAGLVVCDTPACRRYRYLLWGSHQYCPFCYGPVVPDVGGQR